MRTTTTTQELITPPSYPGDGASHDRHSGHSPLRRPPSAYGSGDESRSERRLSGKLRLSSRSRSASIASENVPTDLPDIQIQGLQGEDHEAEWERRATLLVKGASISRPGTPGANRGPDQKSASVGDAGGDVRFWLRAGAVLMELWV